MVARSTWLYPDGRLTTVEINTGGWAWPDVGEAGRRVEGNQLMLAVPRA